MTVTTRAGKGSALTHAELDANFTHLGLAHGDTSSDLNVDQVDATTVNATDVNATDVNATGDIIGPNIKARGILAISDPAVGAIDNHQFRLSVDETDPGTPKLKIQGVEGASSTVREYMSMYNRDIFVSQPMLLNKSVSTGADPILQVEGTEYDSFNVMRTGKTGSSPYSTALYLTVYTDAGHTAGQGTGYWTQVKTNDGTANTGAVLATLSAATDATNYKSKLDFKPVTNNGGSLSFDSAFTVSHDENVSLSPFTLMEGSLAFAEIPAPGASGGEFSNMIKGYDWSYGGNGNSIDYIELGKEDGAWRRVEMKQMFVTHKVADTSNLIPYDIASGTIVFDESDNTFYGYNGTAWVAFH